MNEPRVYKNSPFVFGLLIVMFVVLFGAIFFTGGDIGFSNLIVMIPFALVFGFLFIFLVFTATAQTIISNEEISTKNLLGTKSLTWSQINRVSGRGYRIKLHNFDGDVTVAPSPQLPGYNEVIEWIGVKRPDLFNPQEYSEMKKSWLNTILTPMIGLLIIGIGFFAYTQASDTFFPFLIFIIIGLVFIGMPLASPQAVTIQGNSILLGYLFNQKTLPANEIVSIDLRFTQTRNGKNYFIAINLVNRKTIRVSGLSPNLPVAYLVLKNWHKKNVPSGQTNY
jgi:hypothetical protein